MMMMLRSARSSRYVTAAASRYYGTAVPATMRAAVVHETGAAEVLTLEEAWPVPTLADGQVGAGDR